MAALPLAVVRIEKPLSPSDEPPQAATADNAQRDVAALAASLCGEDFCDEAIRAMVILANTDKAEMKANNYSDKELYSRVKRIYDSDSELYLHKGDESCYIPYAELSGGVTERDENYPFLCPVASPWDCFDERYSADSRCVGVSLRGVNYLCEQGYSAEEALRHYLPDFEISA